MQLLRVLKTFPRSARYFYFTWALFWISGEGINTVLFNIFLLRLSFDTEFIGSTGAIRMLSFAVTSGLAGYLGRKIGLKKTMIRGLIFYLLAMAAVPLLGLLSPSTRGILVYATILCRGFGAALFIVCSYPYLAGAIPGESVSHAFSLQWILQPLSIFAGSLIGGVLPQIFSGLTGRPMDGFVPYQLALISSPMVVLPALLVIRRVEEQDTSGKTKPIDASGRSSILVILIGAPIISMLAWSGKNGIEFFFNVYLDNDLNVATAKIGSIRAIGQIVAAVSAAFVPSIVAKAGKYRSIPVASGLSATCLLLFAIVRNFSGIALTYAGMTAFLTISSAASSVFGQMMVPADKRSILSGLANMAVGVGSSVILAAGGFLASSIGFRTFFLLSSGLIGASAVVFSIFYFKPKGEYRKLDLWFYRHRL